MKYIDLHVHSNISDGTLSPRELTIHAAKHGLCAYALTDHDTTDGIDEALAAADELRHTGTDIRVVPGIEISAGYNNKDIHILGLLIDHKNTQLNKAVAEAQNNRIRRNEKMVNNLLEGGIKGISLEALHFGEPDTVITRAHFGRFLVEHGYAKDMPDAFSKYLGTHTKYYVPREYISPSDTIKLILGAGGIPVLAHPLLYNLSLDELDVLVNLLKDAGLMGIETFYSSNTGMDEGIVRRYANKYNLVMTGGTDYHGANKPHLEIGVGKGNMKIPYSILDELDRLKADM